MASRHPCNNSNCPNTFHYSALCPNAAVMTTEGGRFPTPSVVPSSNQPKIDLDEVMEQMRWEHADTSEFSPAEKEWNDRFCARGYIPVADMDEALHYLHKDSGRYMSGWVSEKGVHLALWDDFGIHPNRERFNSDDEYMDHLEERFSKLWEEWDKQN